MHTESTKMLYYPLLSLIYLLNLNSATLAEFDIQQSNLNKNYIGIHPDRRIYYQLGDNQDFKCLDGSRTIPREFVNDDYCDCHDASDEPGTSACGHGHFFCQNYGYIQKFIPSAWVNDNQCDCCDGSDEHNSNATCENTCQILGELYRQEQERNREISDRGATIRQQYKEQARLKREQNTQLLEQYKREVTERGNAIKKIEEELNADFGPSSVFFPLKGQCYAFKDREYTYTLCPFERATQESTTGMQTELGRWAGWAGLSENQYSRQRYEGGVQCWNGPARSALVNIVCGVEDKVTSVTEPAKCEYLFEFSTPAACPDLDPPPAPLPAPGEQGQENQAEGVSPQSDVESEQVEEESAHESEEEILHDHQETHDEL